MKFIYGLYSQSKPDTIRYIGQSDDPAGRLRKCAGNRGDLAFRVSMLKIRIYESDPWGEADD